MIFPRIFKTAQVVPVFRSKSRLFCNSYRPISLLSNKSKIIEKLIHQRLYQTNGKASTTYNLALHLTYLQIIHYCELLKLFSYIWILQNTLWQCLRTSKRPLIDHDILLNKLEQTMVSSEKQIDGSGHTLKREHILFQLELYIVY